MLSSIQRQHIVICASILNADLANLSNECKVLIDAGIGHLHLDVMDGHFVPNLTFGPCVIQCLRESLGREPFLDVHLMVTNPEHWIQHMKRAGANLLTFHVESLEESKDCDESVLAIIRDIKEAGMKVGIAVKPKTPVRRIFKFVELVDQVLIMSVEPGFGGQAFMPNTMSKVREIRVAFPHVDIQVDGGINRSNIGECVAVGANVIVCGTAITKESDKRQIIAELRENILEAIDREKSK